MPTRFLSFAILHFQNGIASLNRIFEVIDMEKKVLEKEDAEDMPAIKGNVNFKNITFTYAEDSPPVLRNVNLEIKPGETVAFLGTTLDFMILKKERFSSIKWILKNLRLNLYENRLP